MAIDYGQSDDPTACGAQQFCAGGTLSTTAADRTCYAGAATGVNEDLITIAAAGTRCAYMNQFVPGFTSWDAGDWTVRFNVTTANMNLDLVEVWICRVNNLCVNQATVGSVTGLAVNLGTTGVKTQTVTGSSQTASVNDAAYVVIKIRNNATMTDQNIGITSDQVISTPLTAPGGAFTPWRRPHNLVRL